MYRSAGKKTLEVQLARPGTATPAHFYTIQIFTQKSTFHPNEYHFFAPNIASNKIIIGICLKNLNFGTPESGRYIFSV
jgi:hypothetical protein